VKEIKNELIVFIGKIKESFPLSLKSVVHKASWNKGTGGYISE